MSLDFFYEDTERGNRMHCKRSLEWVAALVLALGPLAVAKASLPLPPQQTPRHRLETETERQQGRLDRLKMDLCERNVSDRCRLLGDLDVSLKEVRGELEAVSTEGDVNADEGVRFARKELGKVTRSLDALDPDAAHFEAE